MPLPNWVIDKIICDCTSLFSGLRPRAAADLPCPVTVIAKNERVRLLMPVRQTALLEPAQSKQHR